MARGGSRSGTPGSAYTNRADLNAPKLPATAPTGMPYGEHQQLVQGQQAVPAAPPPSPAPSAAPANPLQPGALRPFPGTPLMAPTQRPNEPVTAGLPMGPGPGPEVLGPQQQVQMSDMLTQAGNAAGSTALVRLGQ